jgi:hypothetical protein
MPATQYDWSQIDPVRRARIEEAESIVRKMNRGETFYDWIHIGEGLREWRDAACELAGTQNLDTPAYRAAFDAARPLYPKLAEVSRDKAERSYSIWMADNRQVLEAWHAGLDDKQRRQWNHPRSVWRHSPLGKAAQAAKKATTEQLPPKTKRGQVAAIDDATERLHHAAEKIERKLEPGLELFDLSPELVDESARNFIEIYRVDDDSIPRFIEALLTQLGVDDRDRILGFLITTAPVAAPEPEPIDPAFKASLSNPRRSRSRKAKSTTA